MTGSGMTGNVIDLRDVEVGYGEHVVIRDLDLSIPERSVVALLGPNGAGKTTLLNAISGTLRLRRGTITLFGEDVTKLPIQQRARRGITHIPDGHGVFPSLTVKENLVLASPKGTEQENIELAANAFPILGQRLSQVAGTMSGGQQQMLSVVRAYIASPKLVLIDEVSMGLAPLVVDEIFTFIAKVAETGTSLLMVEQYVARALEIATEVHILVNGEITYSGSPRDIDSERIMEQYMATPG